MIINIEKTNQTIQSYLDLYLKESNKTKYISKDCFGIFSKLLPSTKIAKSDNLLDLVEEAKESNAIMLSSLTKEILFFGLYSKYGIENLDLFPLGDLFISEISQLTNTPILNKLNYEYSDLEWAFNEDKNYCVIQSDKDPSKTQAWHRYTKYQRELIAQLYIEFHNNKHKNNNKHIILLRNKSFIR